MTEQSTSSRSSRRRTSRGGGLSSLAGEVVSSNSKLYGRQQEQQVLLRAYHAACPPINGMVEISEQEELSVTTDDWNGSSMFVLISGKSGSGKTALANTLRSEVAKDQGFFVSGKFEQMVSVEPYEVFETALTEYVDRLVDSGDVDLMEKVRERVVEAVGSEASLLTDVIPALKRLIGTPEPATRVYGSEGSNRFRFVFCNFIRALTKSSPLVLFLDDLQWANTACTELIWSLLNTSDMSLLLIGAHRFCDNLRETSPSPSCVNSTVGVSFKALMDDLENDTIDVTRIRLDELTIDDLRVMLGDLLDKTTDETNVLGELVYHQSQGNIFYTLQLLKLLKDQGLLTRSEQGVWQWNDDDIQTCLSSEGTITDLIRRTIDGLPRMLQEVLKVASVMGDEIDDTAICMVLQSQKLGSLLEHGVDQGLLIFSASLGGYRFSHDLIRQTAFEMIPEDESKELHLRIGRRLWSSSNALSRDRNIFLIVSLLSKGANLMTEERERYKFAELNLKAGEHAVRLSAFHDASRFLEKGVELLGTYRWRDEYQLSLELFSINAEVQSVLGNSERVIALIGEVVENARSRNDKLSVYCSLMRSMGQQDNMPEVMNVGIDVLKQYGQPLHARASKFVILREFLRVRGALRGRTNEDLLNLPAMEDESSIACMKILSIMFRYGYQSRSPFTVLVALRSVMLTLRFGVAPESAHAFAIYGMTLCALGIDFEAGNRYGQVAVSLSERMGFKKVQSMVYLVSGGAIRHWSEPINDGLRDVLHASRIGMEVGDVETSLMCRFYHDICAIDLGTHTIAAMEKHILESIYQARAYRHLSLATTCSIALQLIHCYTGRTKEASRFSGSVVDFDETVVFYRQTKNVSLLLLLHVQACVLAYLFNDLDLAGVMVVRAREFQTTPSAFYAAPVGCLMDGLVAVAFARRGTQRRANVKRAKASLRKLTRWAKSSPQSYLGKAKLLEAELLSLRKNRDASSAYVEAIDLFVNEGYTKDAALASERMADYHWMKGDENAAIESWSRAISLYDSWGATAKSKQLRINGHMSGQSSQAITLEPQSSCFLERTSIVDQ